VIAEDQLPSIPGASVYGADDKKIGKAGHVYLDELTGQAEWFTVATGLFGTAETFVPVACASLVDGDVRLPFDAAKVKDAPRVAAEDYLSPVEEAELYRYYEMDDARPLPEGDADKLPRDFAGDDAMPAVAGGAPAGEPSSEDGETTAGDGAGGDQSRDARSRLRKFVISEEKKITVTISPDEIKIEEDVRVEREPLPGADILGALAPATVAEESREFVAPAPMPVSDAIQTLERVLRVAQVAANEVPADGTPTGGPEGRSAAGDAQPAERPRPDEER
jgi:hypothetical protein